MCFSDSRQAWKGHSTGRGSHRCEPALPACLLHHTHIETSPRGDIEALFKYGLLARRTEFIITLCKGRGGDGDANAGVEATVEALCAQHFFVILQKGLAYSYGKMEVWAFSLEST